MVKGGREDIRERVRDLGLGRRYCKGKAKGSEGWQGGKAVFFFCFAIGFSFSWPCLYYGFF